MIDIADFTSSSLIPGMKNARQIVSAAIVVITGTLLFTFQFIHIFAEHDSVQEVFLGLFPPIIFSLLIIAAGYWIYISEVVSGHERVFVAWVEAGLIAVIILGYPLVPFQAAHGVQMVDIPFVAINWAAAGGVIGIIIGYYDVRQRDLLSDLEDHRRRLESKKEALEWENERLERLASIISHDLRNPLNVAAGNVELAIESENLDNLDKVKDAHKRAFEIIDESLTLVRNGKLVDDAEVEEVELEGVVR